jgi:predicted PurR-regulated permease PerM
MKKLSSVEWLVRLTIVLLLFLCGYLLIKLTPIWRPLFDVVIAILIPFFIAALITYLLHPIVEALHNRNIPRPLAIIFIYVLFFGTVGYGLFKGVPYMIEQLKELVKQMPGYIDLYHRGVYEFYNQTSDFPETVHDRFRDLLHGIEQYLNKLILGLVDFLKGLFQSSLTILTIPVLVFYFLNDFTLIKKTSWLLTPKKWRERGKGLLHDIDDTLGSYIRGQLFVIFFLTVMASIGLWIAGVPYPILLGALIGITDLIPYFGPFLGGIPAVLMAATVSWKLVIFVVVLIFVLQFVEGNLLSPLIVGKTMHIHPITIIFALLIGGEIGGLIGLLLAVPTFAVLRVVFQHFRLSDAEH